MNMSQPTGTTRPRHPLPDSARSFLSHALLKGIRVIRLVHARHRSGQHAIYTYARPPTQKHGMQRTGDCFMPILITNRDRAYAINQNLTLGKNQFKEGLARQCIRWTKAAKRIREPKEGGVHNFTLTPNY